MKVRNIINEHGNVVKNQFDVVNGYTHTFISYETPIAECSVSSAIMYINEHAFDYSRTTSSHFLNWLENILCINKPTRKDVEKWIKQKYIPMSTNCYSTDVDIRIVSESFFND